MVNPMEVPRVLTPEEVGEILHVKPTWLYEQSRKRANIRAADPLPVIKVGRFLRVLETDLAAWLERRSAEAKKAA